VYQQGNCKTEVKRDNALITSVSIVSLSFSAFWGRIEGGGVSIAAAPFFLESFLGAKNEPKKLCSSFFMSTSRSLLLFTDARGFLGSWGCGGPLGAESRSVMRAVACNESR
jgi:hypothetical protein